MRINKKDQEKLMKTFDKGILVIRIMIGIILVIGFIGITMICKVVGNITGQVHKDYVNTIERHTKQLETPLEIGSTFVNRENLQLTLVDKQQQGKLLMLEFEVNTKEIKYEEIRNKSILSGEQRLLQMTGQTIPKGRRNDEEYMEIFISEGKSKPRVITDSVSLPSNHLDYKDNGYITIPGEIPPRATIGEVYYDSTSRVQYYINTEISDFLIIQPLYNFGVRLEHNVEEEVDGDPTNIYIDLQN